MQGLARLGLDGGFRQRVERFGEELVEVVELTALEIALDACLGFGSCDLKCHGVPPRLKRYPFPPYLGLGLGQALRLALGLGRS